MAFRNHARIFVAETMGIIQVKSALFCRACLFACCAFFLLCSFVTARPCMGQAAASSPGAESASKATTIYKQGVAALQKGDLDSAHAAFDRVVRLAPQSPEGHNSLGWVLLAKNEIDSAIRQFQEALRLKPDYIEARYNLGSAYLNKRRIDEAITEFSEILRRQPDFAPARRGLAKAEQLRSFRNPASP
jgi:Tfp pilus assembly protein PilF